MKVLVTGGAGFIGSHVVDALIERGDKVVVVDNLISGRKEQVNSKAVFKKGSVTDWMWLNSVVKNNKIEAVVHLAAQKNARHSVDDPVFDAEQNIIGTINVLEAARYNKIKRVVFSSTGGVMYGDKAKLPTPESVIPVPSTPYAIAKRSAEQYLRYYSEVHKVSTIALRLANIYGPRQDPKGEAGVVAIFFSKLLNKEQPIIFGSGKQTRDYLYVSDAVSAILKAIDKRVQGIYNIGTGKQLSVNQLYSKIEKASEIKVKAKKSKALPGEQMKSALNAQLAFKKLGWKPKINLESGLHQTFHWFKTNQ